MKSYKEVKENFNKMLKYKVLESIKILNENPNNQALLDYGKYQNYMDNLDEYVIMTIGKMSETLIQNIRIMASINLDLFHNDFNTFLDDYILSTKKGFYESCEICSILGISKDILQIFHPNPYSYDAINKFRILLNNNYGLNLPSKEEEIEIINNYFNGDKSYELKYIEMSFSLGRLIDENKQYYFKNKQYTKH